MHGVKRLFAWMLPRFDPARCRRLARQPAEEGPVGGAARDAWASTSPTSHRSKFDPGTLTGAAEDRSTAGGSTCCTCTGTARRRSAGRPPRSGGIPTILHEHANLTDTPWFQKVADVALEPFTDIAHRGLAEHRGVRDQRAEGARPQGEGRLPRRAARRVRPAAARRRGARRPGATSARRDDDLLVGTVTRLHDSKGNEYLVEAAAPGARPASARAVRRWSARGRCGRRSRPRRARLGLGDRFVFAGFVRDVARAALGVRPERLPVALGGDAADGVRGAGRRQGRSSRPTPTACSTC